MNHAKKKFERKQNRAKRKAIRQDKRAQRKANVRSMKQATNTYREAAKSQSASMYRKPVVEDQMNFSRQAEQDTASYQDDNGYDDYDPSNVDVQDEQSTDTPMLDDFQSAGSDE